MSSSTPIEARLRIASEMAAHAKQFRLETIHEALQRGYSQAEIARLLGVTRQAVFAILKKSETDVDD